MLQDLRYALRTLRKNPGFTALALVTLALGIGANTAVFSVVNGVLIRPLGYREPGRIVQIMEYNRERGLDRGTISYPNFLDWRERSASFEAMAAYDEWLPTLVDGGDPERLDGASVSASFFALLGVEPALGRFFLPADDEPGAGVVVLSHGLWMQRFGGDPAVLGRTLTLSGSQYTVVGVARAGYEDPLLSGTSFGVPDVWRATPSYFDPAETFRGGRAFVAIGRLRQGVSLESAQAEMDAIMGRLAEAYPESNANGAVLLVPLTEQIVGPVRPALLIVLGAAGLVLLIASANVANLLLSRGAGRAREIAIRASLGASRSRLARMLLSETLVLSLLGGLVGLAVALLSTDAIVALGGRDLPRTMQIAVDGRVLAFTAAIALGTGLAFGLGPALQISGTDVHAAIKDGGGTGSGRPRRQRLRSSLVTAQVALALVLLVGAGLLVRSLMKLQAVDPGVRAAGLLSFSIDALGSNYPDHESRTRLYAQLLPGLQALPGVESAAAINILPLSGSFNGMSFARDDQPEPAAVDRPSAEARTVTTDYFRTVGMPIVRGRGFTDADGLDAPPVIVINQAMAERYWPGEDPIGKRLTRSEVSREVVGIVGNVHQFGLDLAPRPTMFTPHAQELSEWMRLDMSIVVRTLGDPLSIVPRARGVLGSVDPTIPMAAVRPMQVVVAETLQQPRFRTTLLALFAAVALALGCVGIYGVVSAMVGQRTRELGIRVSLGATANQILELVLAHGMRPVVLGVGIGLVGSLALSRTLSSLLFGVSTLDPLTLGVVVGTLVLVALLACFVPARRATRIEPMEVLRYE